MPIQNAPDLHTLTITLKGPAPHNPFKGFDWKDDKTAQITAKDNVVTVRSTSKDSLQRLRAHLSGSDHTVR